MSVLTLAGLSIGSTDLYHRALLAPCESRVPLCYGNFTKWSFNGSLMFHWITVSPSLIFLKWLQNDLLFRGLEEEAGNSRERPGQNVNEPRAPSTAGWNLGVPRADLWGTNVCKECLLAFMDVLCLFVNTVLFIYKYYKDTVSLLRCPLSSKET